jgi:hypothetical protein
MRGDWTWSAGLKAEQGIENGDEAPLWLLDC